MFSITKLYKTYSLRTIVSIIVLCSWIWFPLKGQGQIEQSSPSLQLNIIMEKAQYTLGEPLYIILRLQNNGSDTVKVFDKLRPPYGLVQIDITDQVGQRIGFLPFSHVDWDAPPIDLAPNQEIGDVFPIFYGGFGWTFTHPGRYLITAVYRDDLDEEKATLYHSNTFTVDIVSSDNGGEFLLQEGSQHQEAAKFMLWQSGDHLQAGINLLKELINQYPGSVLSDYARYFLGKSLSRHFKDFTKGKVRMPDCKGALSYFEQIREDQLPTYLKIQENIAQGKCYLALNQEELARQHLEEARRLIGTHAEFKKFLKLIEKIGAEY